MNLIHSHARRVVIAIAVLTLAMSVVAIASGGKPTPN